MECWCGHHIASSAIAWTVLFWASCRLEESGLLLVISTRRAGVFVWDASAAAADLSFIYSFLIG